ncbi:Hsp70 family protein [Dactylosporangium sp. AC04546]|uniref:Hsp70 family protein n=1 Tax=Dactylosporangium sp. AC04546 TaxID=2862460 RepID=UPI001EDF1DB8|nr:Hsp70 family protein [Dactylosporangium sp. AC04546]WVK78785.1 Hsp70 family protein [Dactylosporangium sp. AC04546]
MGEATALVVDFGTSASSAALVTGGQVRLLKEPASGLYSWPSAVALEGDRLLVGTAAERRKRSDPAGYRAEFKRDLGQSVPVPLGERAYAPQDLVAAVLGVFRDRAAELHGEPVHRLLLTVPASYAEGDPRRALMVAAGEAAGFPEVQLVAEPVAAAFAPVAGAGFGAGQVVLVYDFGGGTFDAAVIRCGADGVHEVIGHAALDDCGGRDIDALLARHVRDAGGPELAGTLAAGGADGLAGLRMRLQGAAAALYGIGGTTPGGG